MPRIPPRNAVREITARMLAKVPTLRTGLDYDILNTVSSILGFDGNGIRDHDY
jgi:hypothetical protein